MFYVAAIHKTLSCVLQLGNLQFIHDKNSDQAALPNDTVAQKVCHLIGVPVVELTKAFLRPRIRVGREFVTKAQTKEQVFIKGVLCLLKCFTLCLIALTIIRMLNALVDNHHYHHHHVDSS